MLGLTLGSWIQQNTCVKSCAPLSYKSLDLAILLDTVQCYCRHIDNGTETPREDKHDHRARVNVPRFCIRPSLAGVEAPSQDSPSRSLRWSQREKMGAKMWGETLSDALVIGEGEAGHVMEHRYNGGAARYHWPMGCTGHSHHICKRLTELSAYDMSNHKLFRWDWFLKCVRQYTNIHRSRC